MCMGVGGSGEGGLLLVLPLIWAWGAATYRSCPAGKKAMSVDDFLPVIGSILRPKPSKVRILKNWAKH